MKWWAASAGGSLNPQRPGSPRLGSSSLTTSAPSHASASVQDGPASNWVRSRTLVPCNAGAAPDVVSRSAALSCIVFHSHSHVIWEPLVRGFGAQLQSEADEHPEPLDSRVGCVNLAAKASV